MKKFLYIASSFIAGALCMLLAITCFNAQEEKQALAHTESYLAEHYPTLHYEILGVSPSTNYKYYGYFKYSVSVRDADQLEIFEVYYDRSMDRMEDSRKLQQQEEFLAYTITPKVERYVKKHFGDVRYISVEYYMETGKPFILVKFNEDDAAISQADFDAFMLFVKEELALAHGHVMMDYWMGEVHFNEEF